MKEVGDFEINVSQHVIGFSALAFEGGSFSHGISVSALRKSSLLSKSSPT